MKKTITMIISSLCFLILSANLTQLFATATCVSLTGAAYHEDFNTLAVSGSMNPDTQTPPGVQFLEAGSGANTTYAAGEGTGTGGNTYSFGTGTTTDRALGELTSSTVQSTLGICFVNQTGSTITSFTFGYTGEQWRLGAADANVDRLDFQYSLDAATLGNGTWTDVNSLNFSSPNNSTTGALNGNAAGNRTVFSPVVIAPPGGITNGAVFFIRWTPIDVTGSDDGLAIDDISLMTGGNSVHPAPFDFDGDGKTDISVFRPADGVWWYQKSNNNQVFAAQFGDKSDKITPSDFTGDGKTDLAIWRPSSGEWFILRSEDFSYFAFPFGMVGDVPTPGDFDGDGKADAAVFRPADSTWYIRRSADSGVTITTFGTAGDMPVAADYDGDGRTDIAIFRPSNGQWWIQRSTAGSVTIAFGSSADKPVPGDYTGDGQTDPAVWRPSSGEWFILRSEDLSYYAVPFGAGTDQPVPGDYDGDGKFDPAVFRPSEAMWYVNRSTAGILIQNFGVSTDRPVPGAFVP